MLRPVLVVVGTAAAFAAVDLAHKASAGAEVFHPRSSSYLALVLGLTATWTVAIALTRSAAMALGGGVAAGGAIGNVVSLGFWPGIPNPIEVAQIAFNLADVFVITGFGGVVAVTIALVCSDRERLGEPLRLH